MGAVYIEIGDSARIVWVHWTTEAYVDARWMFCWVHKSLQRALDDAGIESPFPNLGLNL